jgi:TRAP-type C4-dicarboxylate transport system permease small subunit
MSTAISKAVSQSEEPRGFRRLWRVVKQLFHEIIGAIFAILAFSWFNSALRAWTRDVAHWLIAVSILVGLLFIAFAAISFRRSREL